MIRYVDADVLVTTPFGERIKSLRDARRLTQDGLAAAVGVSRQTISNWETGTSAPNAVDLPLLAKALRVTVQALYEDDDPPGTGTRSHDPLDVEGQRGRGVFNVWGRREDLRAQGIEPLPIYRWGSMGDPRDHESQPFPDRLDYPPLGRERLVGSNGFGVEVRGESMVGRGIRDGDTCWVNPNKAYRHGDVVLALVDDGSGESGMVVKSYERSDVGDCLMSNYADGKRLVICRQYTVIGPVVLVSPRPFPPQ